MASRGSRFALSVSAGWLGLVRFGVDAPAVCLGDGVLLLDGRLQPQLLCEVYVQIMNRPGRVVMHQSWRHLLFLHWSVPPEQLTRHLPPGLTLDTFEGRAYIGLVPFTMMNIRFRGLPVLGRTGAFHETNVRTYVRRGDQIGVWFFSLDATEPLAVRVARKFWGLPYHDANISLNAFEEVGYVLNRPDPHAASLEVRYRPRGSPSPTTPGTIEHFFVERYDLFSVKGANCFSGRVVHPPYSIQPVEIQFLNQDMFRGILDESLGPPEFACYSPGVDVDVCKLVSI